MFFLQIYNSISKLSKINKEKKKIKNKVKVTQVSYF